MIRRFVKIFRQIQQKGKKFHHEKEKFWSLLLGPLSYNIKLLLYFDISLAIVTDKDLFYWSTSSLFRIVTQAQTWINIIFQWWYLQVKSVHFSCNFMSQTESSKNVSCLHWILRSDFFCCINILDKDNIQP